MAMLKIEEAAPTETHVSTGSDKLATVLVLTRDRELLRSVVGLLEDNRYRVYTFRRPRSLGSLLLDRSTEAVIVDLHFPAATGLEIEELTTDLPHDRAIPIVAVCSGECPKGRRLKALRSGVWDVLEMPSASAELMAKLERWIDLKRGVDAMRSAVLLDVESGHYSTLGIKRRLRELVALARRTGEPFSCALFGADPVAQGGRLSPQEVEDAGRQFALALHHQTRSSDVIGRLEPLKFLVLVPQTPVDGAVTLAERFTSWLVSRRVDGATPITLSAGVAGMNGPNGRVQADPELLLTAAQRALNSARATGAAQVVSAWSDED